MGKLTWEIYEGETYAYLEDGREVQITARTRYSRWGTSDSNTREWFIYDERNQVLAQGKAEGLRAAKAAATAALAENPCCADCGQDKYAGEEWV